MPIVPSQRWGLCGPTFSAGATEFATSRRLKEERDRETTLRPLISRQLSSASKGVGHPVMRPHWMFRHVFPPFARWQVVPALRMQWVVDPIVRL